MHHDKLVKRIAVLAMSAVIVLFSLEALAKKPVAPPSEEEPLPFEEQPFNCMNVVPGLGIDSDGDQYDDTLECSGTDPTEAAFVLPSCCDSMGICDEVSVPNNKTGNCLDPRIKNYLVQFSPNSWVGFNDPNFASPITNEEIILEIEQDLALNVIDVDTLTPGFFGSVCESSTDDHCVARAPATKNEQPKWIVAVENRTLGVSDPTCARIPPYGDTVVSNTVEFSLREVTVNTRVMEEHILGCIGGSPSDYRAHLIFTTVHELDHRSRLTHFPAGDACYLASGTTFTRKGNKPPSFKIPDSHCQATIDAVQAGTTPGGATHCGDFSVLDDGETETCASP